MRLFWFSTFLFNLLLVSLCQAQSVTFDSLTLLYKGEEKFLANVRQLTFEGENAEAYLSFDERQIIFQSRKGTGDCDQIYIMNLDGSGKRLVSTGQGRTTCSYFLPDGKTILYASTHLASADCPPPPSMAKGYTWALYEGYDIFFANADGSNLRRITFTQGYDAEATVSPKGDKIVFTSVRDGDLELYEMDLDGSNQKRLTNHLGYDGGAFYSWDGKKIVFRASTPDSAEAQSYLMLLKEGLVRPNKMEIFVMNADGSNRKQLTFNGKANFAPFFYPDNRIIAFSTNVADTGRGRNFDIHLIDCENPNQLIRVTFCPEFDGFPIFTRDGKKIIFSSNRNAKRYGETNVFIADWIYKP
jgi:Tol biopolymer transport system component